MGNILYSDGTDKYIFPSTDEGFSNDIIQEIIGGYYELIPIKGNDHAMLAVNEDGIRMCLPCNRNASILAGTTIVGTAMVIRNSELK